MITMQFRDNGGKTADRYTAVIAGACPRADELLILGMSDDPSHPQGVHQITVIRKSKLRKPLSGLGKPIAFVYLPIPCQRAVAAALSPND